MKEYYSLLEEYPLRKGLADYLLSVLMKYKELDEWGHGIEHILYTIKGILKLAKLNGLDYSICLATAVYHDIGLLKGREDHEINSAIFLDRDLEIRGFFSYYELCIIRSGIAQHRGANLEQEYVNMNLYSKAMYDADKDYNVETIFRRYKMIHMKNKKYWQDGEFLSREAFEVCFAEIYERYIVKKSSALVRGTLLPDKEKNEQFDCLVKMLYHNKDRCFELYNNADTTHKGH